MTLAIPDNFIKPYNLLAIDPGSNNIGIAIFNINPSTNTINSIYAFTLEIERMPETNNYDPDIYPERTMKLLKIKEVISRLLYYYIPDVVVCEAPFYNRLRPTAYGPLVEVMTVIQQCVIEYGPHIPFHKLEPSIIKKTIGAGHIADKDTVRKTIQANTHLISRLTYDVNTLDEHAIDAIAIGDTFLKLNGS